MSPERDLILFTQATSTLPTAGRQVAQPGQLRPAPVIDGLARFSLESAWQTASSKFSYFCCRHGRINYWQGLKQVLTDIHQTVIKSIKIKTIRCIFC
jgi:hypothetical protein